MLLFLVLPRIQRSLRTRRQRHPTRQCTRLSLTSGGWLAALVATRMSASSIPRTVAVCLAWRATPIACGHSPKWTRTHWPQGAVTRQLDSGGQRSRAACTCSRGTRARCRRCRRTAASCSLAVQISLCGYGIWRRAVVWAHCGNLPSVLERKILSIPSPPRRVTCSHPGRGAGRCGFGTSTAVDAHRVSTRTMALSGPCCTIRKDGASSRRAVMEPSKSGTLGARASMLGPLAAPRRVARCTRWPSATACC
mmetsp:Transcript_16290/g.36473  ORF Transcript_16290/g.36473 Transcript_16290/m.36473 type:complete len:251 (+) Transcript_16290:1903-2655(+)